MVGIFKVGPCGGDGGEPFNMDIDNITRIVKIGIYYSTYIHAITITYIVDDLEETVTWGKPGGTLAEFTLQAGEYIKSIKGYYGGSSVDGWFGVRELIFETSENTHGPYGSEVGTEFELPAIYGEIIGFHGRSDGIGLNALGVYIKVGLLGGSTGTGI